MRLSWTGTVPNHTPVYSPATTGLTSLGNLSGGHSPQFALLTNSNMTSPQMASSPGKGLLSQWWKSLKPSDKESHRPPLHSHHSSSAVMQSSRLGSPQPPEGLWVINGGKKVLVPSEYVDSPIFGVPLCDSIKYASVQISLADSDGNSFTYGHVPVVVAKCSSFLKQNGQTVRGIFRVSGSVRRINVLQSLFNQPPKFGKDVDWSGFTVHDAANILRRYFNMLPEPIVPHNFYESFRMPLESCAPVHDYLSYKAKLIRTTVESDKELIEPVPPPSQDVVDEVIAQYERLLFKLPPVNLHLFVYLLDLMDVFEAMSDENLMPAYNLATIFLTSLLFHPVQNDLESQEYHLSRLVLVFLIENSGALLTRVRNIAIKEHELQRQSKEDLAQPSAPTKVSNTPPQIPSLSVSSPPTSEEDVESITTPNAPTDATPLQVNKQRNRTTLVASEDTDPILYSGRKHSKSMSSASPPAIPIRNHRDSIITQLRRQLSATRRRELTGHHGTDSTTSLQTSASNTSHNSSEGNSRRRSWYGKKR